MGLFDQEKTELQRDLGLLEQELAEKRKRLEKLEKVGEQFAAEPAPGTVLRFSRPVAGSKQKYTFVATRVSTSSSSWYVTGRSNALARLGLTDKANTWPEMLVAMADAKVQVARVWVEPAHVAFRYFQSPTAQWRVHLATDQVEYRLRGTQPWFGVVASLEDLQAANDDVTSSVFEVPYLDGQR